MNLFFLLLCSFILCYYSSCPQDIYMYSITHPSTKPIILMPENMSILGR